MKKSKPQPKPSAKKERIEKQRKPSRERHPDIAVIGMACRFPGAKDYTEFWENLREGRSSIQEIPPERWDWKAYWGDPQGEANKSNSKWGGFVEDVDAFDTGFFGLSAREAEAMDPQQRIMLELSWSCFEDAGISPARISDKKIGVYIGVFNFDYKELQEKESRIIETHHSIGTAPAVIPNRISHCFHFTGPSLAIDTACSSSLHAIHSAIQSLQAGECTMALAGGVSLLLTPTRHISFSKTGMLSPTGSCKTFDEHADGYVRSEGAGLILLKPLEKAIHDGDAIYGLLKGSAVNHSGKTHTLTYPNPEAQAAVIIDAHKRAGTTPESVGYIEAHGTGTPKGDPLEYQGLLNAFHYFTPPDGKKNKKNYCGLGSVKTNIGHLESAAGIAGVIKVLLSMKHKQLPGLQNFKELNHRISIQDSPFHLVKQLQAWKPLKGENGAALPRRAGVSSFGFGGTNAHVVLEEAPVPPKVSHKKRPCHVICLSAKTEEVLQQKEKDLALWLKQEGQHNNLADISATLLLGREHFGIRAATVVSDVQELQEKLKEVSKKGQAEGCFRGREAKKGSPAQPLLETLRHTILKELQGGATISGKEYRNKLSVLAELYAAGYDLDWQSMFTGDSKPRRISLPTYPFAKERYWIPEIRGQESENKGQTIHPLLQQNTSDFSGQRFSSTFTGKEFFLADHIVKGKHVLPGVAYLEMARAAVEQAAGASGDGQTGIGLKNIVWARPVAVGDQAVPVQIDLYPEDSGEIAYEITTKSEENGAEPVVHSQGIGALHAVSDVPTLDIPGIQAQCSQGSLSSSQCYEAFRAMGIEYGPGHQGIERVQVGEGQVLAKLILPSSVSATLNQFVLHPSMMDSALQAATGFMSCFDCTAGKSSFKPALPFALDEIEILRRCTTAMWALIRHSACSNAGDKVQKLDIDLCDDRGAICVRMKGFSSRVLEGEIQTASVPSTVSSEPSVEQLVGTVMLAPVWEAVPVESAQASFSADHVVIVGGDESNRNAVQKAYPEARFLEIPSTDTIDEIAQRFKDHGFVDHVLWIAPRRSLQSLTDDAVIEEQQQGVLSVFRMIKALLLLGYGVQNLGWTVITIQAQPIHTKDRVDPVDASIHGLIGSLAKEYPNWNVRLIDLGSEDDWPISDMRTLPPDSQGNAWAYRGGEWYRQKLLPVHRTSPDQTMYQSGGVYVVIGGAGGIGEAWTEYMVRTYQAQIIWIGRRQKDKAIHAKLARLAAFGPAPDYIAADATDRKALQRAYEEIKDRYGRIHGVIHSAIVLLDQSLANMDEERFEAALSAKVAVSVRMAQVFQKEPLDFVLFFSSIMSFTKNRGQSNYAAGCTFKDAFACGLSQQWPCAVNVMNWGYWGSVGIVASQAYQDRMALAGMGSVEPPEAMEALETLLAGPMDQAALMKLTKPLAMEGITSDESMALYPNNPLSGIQNIKPLSNPQYQEKYIGGFQMKEMDAILCTVLWNQLQRAGLFTQNKTVITDLMGKIGPHQPYDRWLKESIALLVRNNLLKQEGESYSPVDTTPLDNETIWNEWKVITGPWLENANTKAHVLLAENMLRSLPEILTGRIRATDIMFPHSSMDLVEGIYKNNLVADYFNGALADIVVGAVQERLNHDPSARISIIEIGAGTGGTSAAIFKKLVPYQDHLEEYCYTDISRAFLLHAEKEYGQQYSYLNCKIFDVERPLSGQDVRAGGYDIAIATNVLHATKNIRQTLRNTKAVLKKNGMLLLNELSSNSLFLHLTFGLLEGWWVFEDHALRIPGCPGLYPHAWHGVLENEGFRSVLFPAQEAHGMGQQIIVAESDGVVRQKRQGNPSVTGMRIGVTPKPLKEQRLKPEPPTGQPGEITQDLLREKSTAAIKKLVGETLKMPGHKIDSSEPLEKYGIDSILVVQLTNSLSAVLSNISSTLFFEYQTVDALVEHFMNTQRDSLMALTGLDDQKLHHAISKDNEMFVPPSRSRSAQPSRTSSRLFPDHREQEGRELPSSRHQDIAIIGLAGRYPKANTVNEFWNQLKEGNNCITEIPQERWDWREYFDEVRGKTGTTYAKWGGFIEGVDQFDPLFFQLSPREAEQMDPQERLFLEVSHASIEDAGYTPATLCDNRRTGVFVGVMNGNYPSGSSYWSIANRISYLFNFQGPSMAVDTACSSSLTAIHLAVESLQSGMSECAIAGGVNVIVDPVHYMRLSAMAMLSSGDQCKSFGDRADGFVDGEGVGAIVLKSLPKAMADGDHIYGIIKGSMLNAGGKTNGYTVPNPNAQFQLIAEALQRARCDARLISYVEAHGTGTALGDPIEIAGLTRAFEQATSDKQFCAIGSVKSNIGHSESAAGIAGVTKILLQLKHRQLAPSLHSQELNPNIDFGSTPFVVQQELGEWKRPLVAINGEAREYPRIAGISSFGAGGSNAHVIIEEYIAEDQEQSSMRITSQDQAIIVLSAKNEERLREHVKQLLIAIQEQHVTNASLIDMAYTLQVGREAMEERLAVIVGSVKELEEKLERFLENQDSIEDLYRGQVKHHKENLGVFTADEEFQETVDKWIHRRKYAQLVDVWVKGFLFDWNKLYGEGKPRRISLPTYPFARERYWIPERRGQESENNVQTIHPLLHQNSSDIYGPQFSSAFTGKEFFLSDHVVKGRRILPGVAHLEMGRAAVEQAAGVSDNGHTGMRLNNIVWARPVAVGDQPVQVSIGLIPEDNGEISYEIYSESNGNGAEPIIHSQGRAVFSQRADVSALDLPALQAQCSQNSLSPTQCYEAFQAMGIDYGPGHQGIDQVHVGQGQVLAKLILPSSVSPTQDQFVLHPSIMDSALQASIGLLIGASDPTASINTASLKPALPFALEELEILGSCTSSMWAFIRYSEGSTAGDAVQKLDIDLCDDEGTVCVRMKGFSSRVLEGEVATGERSAPIGTLLLEPVWKEQAIAEEAPTPEYAKHIVMLCEVGAISPERIETRMSGVRCLILESRKKGIEERFQRYAVQAFEEIQGILNDRPKDTVLIQIVVSTEGEQHLLSGLSGLLKSVHLENPRIIGQVIEIDSGEDAEGIVEKLKENSRSPFDSQIRHQDNKRWVAGWGEIQPSQEETSLLWKDGGVYLITGGAGGLGLIFAKEIAHKVKDATLILTGRSTLNEDKQAHLKNLQARGARIVYQQVDVARKKDVSRLIQGIRKDFGSLQGIIHSAGVIRDNFIIKKSKEEFGEVLTPKVGGLVHLDQASKDLDLDFFILFSSMAGSMGNTGQGDYAAANAFMDAYARYRNDLVASNQRFGQTLSINWPLWKEGGMRIDEATENMLTQRTGMIAMETATGIGALYQGFASGKARIMVMEGKLNRLRATILEQQPRPDVLPVSSPGKGNETGFVLAPEALREKAVDYFKKLLSSVFKLPAHRIEADVSMEKYGIDSIMVMELTNQLEKTFGSLSKTLFFEYQTIQALTGYFLESHRDQLLRLLGIGEDASPADDSQKAAAEIGSYVPTISSRRRPRYASRRMDLPEEKGPGVLDIAIIGVSGRYPGARNIQEFWNNLRDGKDCITEIPKDRWDHSRYFDEDKGKPGKTCSKWGGFLDGVDEFDPVFFNISPREAEFMDPQERLFLECVFEALEDAGYTGDTFGVHQGLGREGNVGVYAGVMYEEYQLYGAQEQSRGRPIALNGSPSSIANRVSYFCNFHGPSMAVDTMCSSSLTAIHLACESLQRGGCELAIAGGVNVSIHPNKYLLLGQGKFVSSTGRCESFGEGGDGYVPGEGVGAVLLKPLTKAITDRDHIYGVIKGTTINHGGKTNGYTVPNPNAQASVIGRALKETGIDPRTISYIEAHGTGTSLGDPIEIAGLTKAFQAYTKDKQFCAIGSAKSNIGHCESAAGIAGVTKVLLQMRYGQLAPSLHSEVLNPHIDFSNTPFMVQQKLAEWKRPFVAINGETREYPRIAGISSFGAGGSNAHVMIEEFIPRDQERPAVTISKQNPALIVLSAKNEERLNEQAQQLLAAIKEQQFTDEDLADVAYTLQVGREAMEERLAVMVGSAAELEEKLSGFVESQDGVENLYRGQVKRHNDTLAVFAADEDLLKAIDAWITKGKYSKLLDLWVKGLLFDWNKLYADIMPRRISLPTYPFARDRYWVPGDRGPGREDGRQKTDNNGEAIDPLLRQSAAPLSEKEQPARHSSQLVIVAGSNVLNGHDKPKGISLEPLSGDHRMAGKPAEQTQHAITLPSKDMARSRPAISHEHQQPVSLHEGVSAEQLGEDLATSLAEALYLKRSYIDVDKQFVDMGLDSVVGVEWIGAINKRYGTSIAATKVYEHANIREFSKFLGKKLNNNGGGGTAQTPFTSAPCLNARSDSSAESLREELAASLAEALYLKQGDLDVDKQFVDMGLDSVIGVEWIGAINKRYGTSIAATKVYEHANIREFSKFLGKELNNNGGGGTAQTPFNPASSPSLDDVLLAVQQGSLTVDAADQLLDHFPDNGE